MIIIIALNLGGLRRITLGSIGMFEARMVPAHVRMDLGN